MLLTLHALESAVHSAKQLVRRSYRIQGLFLLRMAETGMNQGKGQEADVGPVTAQEIL